MSKTVVGLLAGGAATVVVGAGGYLAYNKLSQPNTSNVSVQQANTNTAPAVKNNLLGNWVGVDDPAIKVTFTEDEITVYEKDEAKGNYKLLCGSQVVEITNGDLANNLMKMTIKDSVLTLEALDRRLRFRREPGDGSPVADTIVQAYTPVKNDLPGTWLESVAEGNDEPLKFTFTADKMTESSGKSSNYKYLCEGVIETNDGNDFIVIATVKIEGNELTWVGNGKSFKLKRESSSVDYTKFKEFRSLTGASEEEVVLSVAFSPDGKTLASGGSDNTLKLWNVEDGKEIHSLSGHTGGVRSVAFSPDGKTMASGSYDTTIKLWNVEDGKEIRTLSGHTHRVTSVVFSPDGKTMASGSYDTTIKLWNVEDGKEIRTLSGHNNGVNAVVFSPDGKTLASGLFNNTIKLWNVEDGNEILSLSGYLFPVWSVAFSPDGKTLASGSQWPKIKLWNVEDGKEIRSFGGDGNPLNSITFSPDGKTLAGGGHERPIRLWNVEDGKEIHSLAGHSQNVYSIAFSPDGKTLASGSVDGTVKLWRAE